MTTARAIRDPGWPIGLLQAAHAALFAWGGWVLPWRRGAAFTWITLTLAALHVFAALVIVARHRRAAAAWRLQAYGSLSYLAYVTHGMLSSALYVSTVHHGLGT